MEKQGKIRVRSYLEKGRKEGVSMGYAVVGDFGGDENSSFKKRASGRVVFSRLSLSAGPCRCCAQKTVHFHDKPCI